MVENWKINPLLICREDFDTMKGNWKQYMIVLLGLSLGLGFSASMFAQNYTGGGSSSPEDQQENSRNFTEPGQNFRKGSFGKSYNEQVVIAARNDKAFVNAYYENQEQRQELMELQSVTESFGDRVYIQVVNSTTESEILTRNGIVEFPKVIVVGGAATQRGLAPRQSIIPGNQYSNITQLNVERAVCNSITNLGSQAARCQQIGAF
jgi:hypothetical protein